MNTQVTYAYQLYDCNISGLQVTQGKGNKNQNVSNKSYRFTNNFHRSYVFNQLLQ